MSEKQEVHRKVIPVSGALDLSSRLGATQEHNFHAVSLAKAPEGIVTIRFMIWSDNGQEVFAPGYVTMSEDQLKAFGVSLQEGING